MVLIGAGRGERLMPLTADVPKSFAEIGGKRILDWTLDAFAGNGLDEVVFIGGYRIDAVRQHYPSFTFVENTDWANNNILFSLLCAKDYLADGFYSTYTDTLFRADAVEALKESPHDITLVSDTLWREHYAYRTQHPESDGEKMIAESSIVKRLSRDIAPEDATGEFTGVLKMSAAGAATFLSFCDDLAASLGSEGAFVDGRPYRMAYLIHVFDRMIQTGIPVHCVEVPGQYHEIDTLEDYGLATPVWREPT